MAALPLSNLVSQSSSGKTTARALTAVFGDGYQQDAPDGINNLISEWTLNFDNLSSTDKNTLIAFFKSVGSWTPFTWTDPTDGLTKNWKITKDGWSMSVTSGSTFSMSVAIKQVF